MGAQRLSVVVPAYNECGVIARTVARLRNELRDADPQVQIIIADDGSTDETTDAAEAAGADEVLRLPHAGKGAAVRAAMKRATGQTVCFVDADLAYSPQQVLLLVEQVEAGFDVAVGTRRRYYLVTDGRARPIRRASSRAFSALTGTVLLGEQRDTQCGIKAFNAKAVRAIFERSVVNGFAFDVEIFVIARELGLSLTEVPVAPSYTPRSSVRLGRHSREMVRDLLRIRWRAARGRYGQT